jgi:4-hydroxybenzoate polyprenyltransferase
MYRTPRNCGDNCGSLHGIVLSLRPRQWPKNALVFAGVIFGGRLFDRRSLLAACAAFVAFCVLSSAVYLVNDIMDRDADRRHPLKSRRPIASGRVHIGVALAIAAILSVAGLWFATSLDLTFGVIALLYVVLMAFYVSALKHAVFVDVLAISAGFVLRAWAGAAVVHVPVSHWLLILTLLLAAMLSLIKRRAELIVLAHEAVGHRPALRGYSVTMLDRAIAVLTASTLVAYGLYTVSPETTARFGTNSLLVTLPFAAFGIARYLYLVYRGAGGSDPSEHLLSDLPLLGCVGLWVLTAIAVIYYSA